MHPSILLTLLCLGIVSAAPKVDHSVDAQPNQWMAAPGGLFDTIKSVLKDMFTGAVGNVIKKHLLGEQTNFKTAIKAPGDMASVPIIELPAVEELTPEPEAQKEERPVMEMPLPMDSGEEGSVLPGMRK